MSLKELSLNENRNFYRIETAKMKEIRYFNSNIVWLPNVEGRVFKKVDGLMYHNGFRESIYKKKYNCIVDTYDVEDHFIFKTKYKKNIHRLSIIGRDLIKIETLPKNLLVLWVQGSAEHLSINMSAIPKSIVSMTFKWAFFPLSGKDLSKFTNLRNIQSTNKSMIKFPKFNKDIEYIYMPNNNLGFNFPASLNGFKLKNHPNLKEFNVSGSGIPKSKIPQEWKDAKKAKKIKIKF